MKAICKRELNALLRSLRGWGYVAVALLTAGVCVLINNIMTLSPQFEMNVSYIALGLIPATALATADSFQAERRQNMERVIYSLPVSNAQIVLGKLIALMVPVLIMGAGLCLFPLMLSCFGKVYMPMALYSILALVLLGAAMMSIGLCISACSAGRTVAFLATVVLLAASWAVPYAAQHMRALGRITPVLMIAFMAIAFTVTYLLSNNAYLGIAAAAVVEVPMLAGYLQGTGAAFMSAIADLLDGLNLFSGFTMVLNGVVDGGEIIRWLAVTALFALFTILYIGNRRQAKRRAL